MTRPATTARETERRIATELESCVLGVIAEHQPCTAYVVRRYLEGSLSSYWSASAGAIYPLLRRLEKRGWIRADEQTFGTRTRRSFRLTRTGRQRLHDWFSPAGTAWAAAFTYDPLRTRVFFLDHLPPKRRIEFLDGAISASATALGAHRAEKRELATELSAFDALGRDGAIAELEARVRWLRSVRDRVAGDRGRARRPQRSE